MTHLSTLVEIAADLRRRADQFTLPFSTTQIIETCFPSALVTGRVLPKGVLEAVSRTERGPVILYARGLTPLTQRHVIAHALAHLLFDGDRGFRVPGQPADPRVERRANAFADELLVPFEYLIPRIEHWPAVGPAHEVYLDHVDQLASRFAVESKVIARRIRRLKRLAEIRA
jgi:Zn-dependent peptidase ImmA (M78 family)